MKTPPDTEKKPKTRKIIIDGQDIEHEEVSDEFLKEWFENEDTSELEKLGF